MDRLYIEDKYIVGIEEWVGENKSLLIEGGYLNKNTPLPLSEFMLVIIYQHNTLEVIIKGGTFEEINVNMVDSEGHSITKSRLYNFSVREETEGVFNFGFILDNDALLNSNVYLMSNKEYREELVFSSQQSALLVCEILIYLMFHKQEMVLEKKVTKSKTVHKKPKKNSNKKSKTYIEHHYKLVGYEGHKKSGTFTRRTESWTVRGHMRKLKDGKIVFIKPYVKGTGKRVDKDYKL